MAGAAGEQDCSFALRATNGHEPLKVELLKVEQRLLSYVEQLTRASVSRCSPMVIAATLLATAVALVDAHDTIQVLLVVNVSNVVDVVVDSLVKRLRVAVIEVLAKLEELLVLMEKENVDVDTVVETVCVAVIEVLVKLEEILVLMEEEEVDEDAVVDTVVETVVEVIMEVEAVDVDTVVDTVVDSVGAVIEMLAKLEELLVLLEAEEVDVDTVVDTVVETVHVPVGAGRGEDMVSSYTSLRRARSFCSPPTMYIRLWSDTQKPRKKARLLGSEPLGLASCQRLA